MAKKDETLEIPSWSEVLAPKDDEIPEGFQSLEQIKEQTDKSEKTLTTHYLQQRLAQEIKNGNVERVMRRSDGRMRAFYRIKAKA